jgi:ADP-heptose:LPS heptosyltransferase
MKIIFLKRDKLGDLLLTTPALQHLKNLHPNIKLSVVAPESSGWILKNAPFIDQLYIYPQPKSFNFKSIISVFLQAIIFLRIRNI